MAVRRAKKAKARKPRPGLVKVVNPATGKVFETFPITTKEQVNAKVEKARDAFTTWSRLDVAERAAYLQRFAEILRKHKEDYGRTMTNEMGKIIRESLAEVEKCAWAADYFAQNSKAFLTPEEGKTDAQRAYVAFHPRGVLGSIMPWNFPMWQIIRFAIPALAAGNTAVIKPASASPRTGRFVEEAFREAGLPKGAINLVSNAPADAGQVVEALIAHPQVRRINFTGATRIGRIIAETAGRPDAGQPAVSRLRSGLSPRARSTSGRRGR